MPSIDIRADTSSATTALNQFTAQLQAVNDRIQKVTSVQGVFNQFGVQVGAIVRGLTKDGKEFTAQLEVMGKAARAAAAMGIEQALSLRRIDYKSKAREVEDLAAKTNNWEQILARTQRALQYFVAYRAFSFISSELQQGVQSAKDFQIQLSLIRTLSQDNQQSFVKFGQDVRAVSDKSGIDINKVGKAFYDTISNQIAKGADTKQFVQTATDLARVTGSELPDSVNLLSSAINAYGMSVQDAEKLSAIFFRTIDEGRVVSSELANTFGRVAVLGSNLGVSIEELNSVIAITTQKGFKTSDALTLLTNLLIKLEKPTDATKAFFASLGVSTGEAAVKMLGFNGVLRKMVEAVKSGQVDVSAFFDEIRGRKQFGVFEQSIDQIENFSNKLKDTTETMKVYSKAIEIRGESPADKLVKEFNKLSNIMTVDLGQGVLKFTADLLTMVGGIDSVTKVADKASLILKGLGIVLVAYGVTAVGTAAVNAGLAGSFAAVGGAALAATRVFLPLLAAIGAYEGGKRLFKAGEDNVFGKIDPNQFNATADAIERVRQKYDALKTSARENPFAKLEEQSKTVTKTFQETLGLVAGANKANNKFLDDAKEKSKLAAEAIKVGFGAYTDTMKKNISEIKKGITEANNEIEKSKKSMLGFKDSLEKLIFDVKMKYANENFGGDFGQLGGQKAKLMDQQIGGLRNRAYELFGLGTPEAVDEARKIFDEIGKLEKERFEFLTDTQKKQAEASGATGIFLVDVTPLQQKLNALLSERNALETKYTQEKQRQITQGTAQEKKENEKLDKLQQAMKAYEKLDVFDSNGGVKAEYKDKSGRFDPAKLRADAQRIEDQIRNNYSGTFEERVNLEKLLFERRTSLSKEASAQERADFLKTYEQRLLGEQENYQKQIADIKKVRQEEMDRQKALFTAIGEKPGELAAFGNKVFSAGGVKEDDKKAIAESINAYSRAVQKLFDDMAMKDGVKLFKPENLEQAKDAYDRAIKKIMDTRDKAGKGADLTLQDANGRDVTPGFAREAFNQQVQELMSSWMKIQDGLTKEKVGGKLFDELVGKPIEQLKAQFPELANTAKDATVQMGQSFRDLANGGVEDLRKKLAEIQKLLQMGGGKINAELGGNNGEAGFMATGGIVGAFPGQPRGADRYPIWAAKGEYIVNARSTAIFKPMLEAINNARTPKYMATGGIIGANTTIGDINVTVNGASTNNDTGRAIANRLERELRRRNINLTRK